MQSSAAMMLPMSSLRIKRVLVVGFVFAAVSWVHMVRHSADAVFRSFGFQQQEGGRSESGSEQGSAKSVTGARSAEEGVSVPRLQYVRPKGNARGLLSIFDGMLANNGTTHGALPVTAREIARRYGIPETSRDVICKPGETTTVGWIPSESSFYNVSLSDEPYQSSGKIPRLIFQSWKTSDLSSELCEHVLVWSKMNPGYDYFLFDDDAIDRFIRMEYGTEIFSSYACVKVGAAKCDVWRLLVIYLFGGLYFDFDTRLMSKLDDWGWGPERDVVTGRSCKARKHPGGCAHQWGLVYAPRHPVIRAAVRETLANLAERTATHVYDISFWSYYNAWRNGPYNQSYMPGWGEGFGGRVQFQDNDAKGAMVGDKNADHWPQQKQMWHSECM